MTDGSKKAEAEKDKAEKGGTEKNETKKDGAKKDGTETDRTAAPPERGRAGISETAAHQRPSDPSFFCRDFRYCVGYTPVIFLKSRENCWGYLNPHL